MVKTRGGGSFSGRKLHDVPEQQRSPERRSSKRRHEENPGEENTVRRSPRLSKTRVTGGDTGSKTQKVTRRTSGAPSKKRLCLDRTKKETAEKSKKKQVGEPAIEEPRCLELALFHGDEISTEKKMEEAPSDIEEEENREGQREEARDVDEGEVRDDEGGEEPIEEPVIEEQS